MALAVQFTFSAETVKQAFQTDPKYATKLRLFRYGAMQFDDTIASFEPKWVTSTQSYAADPLQGSWYTAAAATGVVTDQRSGENFTAFPSFSATCLYFGVELLAALGPEAPPIGLIQSAVGGSTIEAWMSNATLGRCRGGECVGGGECANGKPPTDQHVPAMLYYGYVTPFVNMSIFAFLWYQVTSIRQPWPARLHWPLCSSLLGMLQRCMAAVAVSVEIIGLIIIRTD